MKHDTAFYHIAETDSVCFVLTFHQSLFVLGTGILLFSVKLPSSPTSGESIITGLLIIFWTFYHGEQLGCMGLRRLDIVSEDLRKVNRDPFEKFSFPLLPSPAFSMQPFPQKKSCPSTLDFGRVNDLRSSI
jgi:hypothetical protein